MDPRDITVLILDDEPAICSSLADFLEDFDYRVMTADSGEVALEILDIHRVHVAIVDMRLPGMDGNVFVTQAQLRCPSIRFIVHTGSVNYQLTPDVKRAGVDASLVFFKPVSNMMDFVDAISRLTAAAPR